MSYNVEVIYDYKDYKYTLDVYYKDKHALRRVSDFPFPEFVDGYIISLEDMGFKVKYHGLRGWSKEPINHIF